jgi:hypothetical protein
MVSLAGSSAAACTDVSFDADGGLTDVEGGTLTAAASQLPQNPQGAPSAPSPPFDYAPLTPGNTWTALYADYFGPPQPVDGGYAGGRASCAAAADCHGIATQTGALSSKFVCADQLGCYQSITSQAAIANRPVLLPLGEPFSEDYLYTTTLRSAQYPAGVLRMPLAAPPVYPTAYTFSETDVERIAAWVEAGAPNN